MHKNYENLNHEELNIFKISRKISAKNIASNYNCGILTLISQKVRAYKHVHVCVYKCIHFLIFLVTRCIMYHSVAPWGS